MSETIARVHSVVARGRHTFSKASCENQNSEKLYMQNLREKVPVHQVLNVHSRLSLLSVRSFSAVAASLPHLLALSVVSQPRSVTHCSSLFIRRKPHQHQQNGGKTHHSRCQVVSNFPLLEESGSIEIFPKHCFCSLLIQSTGAPCRGGANEIIISRLPHRVNLAGSLKGGEERLPDMRRKR